MTPHDLHALESSWRHAEPIADTVIRLFYRRLFQQVPDLRERFCTSMSEQGDQLLEVTEELVSQHGAAGEPTADRACDTHGSCHEHDAAVVDAWLWALEQEIGSCATAGARDAWREAITSEPGTTFRQVAVGELALVAG